MWQLTAHHKSLDILIRRQREGGNLLVACLGPVTIKGPVNWTNCDLRVSVRTSPDGSQSGFVISDVSAGVEVTCGALELKENVKLD